MGNPWNAEKNWKDKLKFIGNGKNAMNEYEFKRCQKY
jgi:hypothetical protein